MPDKKEIKERVKAALEKLARGSAKEALTMIREIFAPGAGDTIHGTPVSVLRMVGEEIGKFGQENYTMVMPFLDRLWVTAGREERFCVGHALGNMGEVHYEKVLPVMYEYMPGVDWEALESMAWGVGKIVSAHPGKVIPTLKKWARDENQWVRKSVSHSMVILLNRTKKTRLEDIMSIMDILIKDGNTEVRKSIGFVFRQVSKVDPQRILVFFGKWVTDVDQYVRWNIANGSRNLGKEVLPVLKELAADRRKFVLRAAASALKDIARKHKEVEEMIKEWENDPDEGIQEAARTALSYVKERYG